MSRIHFDSKQEFGRWLQDRNPDKYELYVLPGRTIAVPTVSTRPVLYGVLDEQLASSVLDMLIDEGYGPAYRVEDYRFKAEEAESGRDQD